MHSRDPKGEIYEDAPPSGVLYAAAFGVAVTAFYAASMGLGIEDPVFSVVVTVLAGLGSLVSYLTRRLPSAGWSLAALVGSVVGVLLIRTLSGGADTLFFPSSADGSVHRNLGAFLCWLLVLLSFAQLSSGWLLFSCVPAAAILGLTGTVYSEPGFLWVFFAFVVLGTFMIVHEHHSRINRARPPSRLETSLDVWTLAQLYVATACCVGAVAVARIVAEPMHAVGTALLPLGVVGTPDRAPDRMSTGPRVEVSELSELPIGRGPTGSSEQTLMRIRAEHGSYWRGATFERYVGSGWRTALPPPVPVGPTPSRGEPSAMFDPRDRASVDISVPRTERNRVLGASHALRQYVRLEGAGRFTDLYAAGEARSYRLSEAALYGIPLTALGDEAGRVTLSRPIDATYYEAESEVPEWSPDTLRRADGELPASIAGDYLSLDIADAARARLRAVAEQVTRGATNDYDRVMALQRFVSSTCVYNLEAPPISPNEGDAVSQFLFNTREGYCDLFASALAVLCRTVGVPSRVASGFTSGEFDPGNMEYVVRERDKHLWTEVWFGGVGWISFDATTDARDVSPVSGADGLLAGRDWVSLIFRRGSLPPIGAALALLLVGWVIKREVLTRLRLRRLGASASRLGPDAVSVLLAYAWLGRRMKRWQWARGLCETPEEYARRLGAALAPRHPVGAAALTEITDLVVKARYAGQDMTARDAARARSLAAEVVRSARLAARGRERPLAVAVTR